MIREDLHRAYSAARGSRIRRLYTCLRSPGTQAVVVYRLTQWLRTQPLVVRMLLKPFAGLQAYRIRRNWGIDISPEARIGPGFHIMHFGGIFIGGEITAGSNLMIMHDVTLGYSNARHVQGYPVIGNNVFIAPGAKVVGNIRIGNNVKIGANAVVERSIPDNAVVQMRPMLVVTWPDRPAKEVISSLVNSAAFLKPTAA